MFLSNSAALLQNLSCMHCSAGAHGRGAVFVCRRVKLLELFSTLFPKKVPKKVAKELVEGRTGEQSESATQL